MGSKYEEAAASYLKSKGYRILDRNYHAGRFGELDLIAKDKDGTLVICECKYRSDNEYGDPLAAVDYKKQRQISRTTLHYCMKHGYSMEKPIRFDVIAIYGDETIKHIENAFEYIG